MILNPDKCHFMTLGFQDQNFDFHYKNVVIRNSAKEKILGITIGNKLNFKSHINICTVVNQKLSALCNISNTFVKSHSHTALSHGCFVPENPIID